MYIGYLNLRVAQVAVLHCLFGGVWRSCPERRTYKRVMAFELLGCCLVQRATVLHRIVKVHSRVHVRLYVFVVTAETPLVAHVEPPVQVVEVLVFIVYM